MYSFSQALQRAALVNGNGIATRYEGRDLTWNETLDRVRRMAAALASLGIREGDRVALIGGNSDSFFQALYAVIWAGGIAVPINTRLAAPEVAYCLNDSGSRILLVDEEYWHRVPAIRDTLDTVEKIVPIGGSEETGPALEELARGCQPADDRGRGGSDIAALYYTGGTTGRAKGVILTHEGILVNVLQWALALGVTNRDVILIVAPMFHLVGGLNAIAATMLAATACLVRRFDVPAILTEITESRVTKTALVPVMVDAIINHPQTLQADLSSLRRISYGGAPMTEAGLKRALRALPDVRFSQIYGQTEGGPNISILEHQYHVLEGPNAGRLRSAGKPMPGTMVAILDEEDRPVPRGQIGEICVRGLTISPGYWNQPEETARAKRNGWLHTGDAGYFDEEGFLYIVDRLKDMIITGGENVYSAEVENVISLHEAVEQCVVIGIPNERWGEQIHAIVRLRQGHACTEEELVAHCREHLAGSKCVRSVEFRAEPFPLSGANKVLKRELREPYWRGRDRGV